jgi:hypothetical protein
LQVHHSHGNAHGGKIRFMKEKLKRILVLAAAPLALALAVPATATATPLDTAAAGARTAMSSPGKDPPRSARSAPAATYPDWAQQFALSKIAGALYKQGRGAFASTYSNIYVDVPHGQIRLYATNATRARQLIQAAKAAQHGINTSEIKVVTARYTKKAIDAQIASIMSAPASAQTIYSAAEAPDGSGIQLSVKPGTSLAQVHAAIPQVSSGIPATVTPGTPIHATTWRWNDTQPFIGGDVVIGAGPGGENACSTGLALEDYTNFEDYIVTAAHCFNVGASVYGEGDPIGDFGGTHGHYFGKVVFQSDHFDAEVIDTGNSFGNGSNSDEADTPGANGGRGWIPVPEDNYSLNGESFCQDGDASYYITQEGVVCGIKITNDDITYNESWDDGSVHSVQGEEATRTGYAITQGDSGGLNFTICGSNCRNAIGQNSAETGNGPSSATMFFVDAPDVIQQFPSTEQNPFT